MFKEGPPPSSGNETEEEPANNETGESQQDVPLIDEDIFDGEADQTEVKVNNLFLTTDDDKKKEAELVADDIPDGVNVKEHDESEWNSN